MQVAPVTLVKRPKAFDRSQAQATYETLHPEFVKAAGTPTALEPRAVFEVSPQPYFQTQLTRVLFDRMQGLPIVNTKLVVDVLPFEKLMVNDVTDPKLPVEIEVWLGMTVTPWSVQAVVAAADKESVFGAGAGGKIDLELPGGVFTFIVTDDNLLGKCAMLSLKSPVFEFSDQATARAFALACDALIKGREAIPEESEVENPKLTPIGVAGETPPSPSTDDKPKKLSRRAFFGGK